MVQEILFPFREPRPYQDLIMKDIYNAVKNREHLILHAPTGLGKTAGALAPALTAAIKYGHTVFFLTPKHTQHKIAIETLQKIREKYNMNFIVADIIGKQWMCNAHVAADMTSGEFQEYCKDLRKEERCPYFNNVWNQDPKKQNAQNSQLKEDATKLLAELKAKGPLHVEDVTKLAEERNMCAYEIATLLAKEAKVIIADYYHLFHPNVREAFLKRIEKQLSNSIIIVDEAHQLGQRVRDILSSHLNNIMCSRAMKEAKGLKFTELSMSLEYLSEALENLALKLEDRNEMYVEKDEFIEEVEHSTGWGYHDLIAELEIAAVQARKHNKRSACGGIANFLTNWEGPDIGFARILKSEKTKRGNDFLAINYNCLSPDISTAPVIETSVSTTMMSGTLVPTEMHRDLLGFPPNTKEHEYDSPFPRTNRLVLIEPTTTTKFTSRSEDEFKKIASECARISNQVPHNTAIFFPSYHILNSIQPYFKELCSKPLFAEKPDMNKIQKQDLLEQFKLNSESGSILLGVQGGSLSEGIDLPGKFLEVVLVVGVPLSKPTLETQALIDYYDYRFKKGWNYGYVFPAMTRSLQAAGRCIRDAADKGAIIFMDKRFDWQNYKKCIPPEWNPITTKLAAAQVKRFFENKN